MAVVREQEGVHVRRGVHRDEARERQRAQRQEPAAADTHAPEHGEERGPPEKGREREKVAELRDVHRELVVRLVAERELAAVPHDERGERRERRHVRRGDLCEREPHAPLRKERRERRHARPREVRRLPPELGEERLPEHERDPHHIVLAHGHRDEPHDAREKVLVRVGERQCGVHEHGARDVRVVQEAEEEQRRDRRDREADECAV